MVGRLVRVTVLGCFSALLRGSDCLPNEGWPLDDDAKEHTNKGQTQSRQIHVHD